MRMDNLWLWLTYLVLLVKAPAFAGDTLNSYKPSVSVSIHYGVPVYNTLWIHASNDEHATYPVKSDLKGAYDFLLTYNKQKLNYNIGVARVQSEFKGKEFSAGAGQIPYKGANYPYSYDLYQNVSYNLWYLTIGIGYKIKFGERSQIIPAFKLCIPALYDFKINNVYSGSNQKSDTTLFQATKNAWNADTNFGRFPGFNLSVSYKHVLSKRIALTVNVSLLYALSIGGKRPEENQYNTVFDHSGNYSYLAYTVKRQQILSPFIGLSYKLN